MSEQAVRQIELKQICFIDDSKTSAYVTKKLLTQQGFAVDHFPDAESALEALMENDYDLVITDLMISADGGVNGDDLIRLIRHSGHPTKSTIPIMVVTGANDASVYDELISAGANRVLPKPLSEQALHEAIVALTPKVTQFGPAAVSKPDTVLINDSDNDSDNDSELLDLNLDVEYDDIITESILPDLENIQNLGSNEPKPVSPPKKDIDSAIKKETKKEIKTTRKPSSTLKLEPEVKSKSKPKTRPKSEFDIPVLTRVAPPAAEIEAKNNAIEDGNRAITERIEQLIETKFDQLIEARPNAAIRTANPQIRKQAQTNQQSRQNEALISSQAGTHGFEKIDNIDIRASRGLEVDSSEEIPPSMMQSIQNELTQIDESVAEKSANLKAGLALGLKSEEDKHSPPHQSQRRIAPQPVIAEPQVSTQKAISEKQQQQQKIKENPLLDLLNHMDAPSQGDDFSAVKQKNIKIAQPRRAVSASFWVTLILIMVIPASIFWYLGQQAVDVKVIQVKQGPIYSQISVPGRVVSKRNITVNARAAGQLMEVRVKEGDLVDKGQIMALMDDKEAKTNVKRAEARLISIQEEVSAASKTQERLQRALDLGAVSRQIVEDAEAAWKSASAKQTEVEQELIGSKLKLDRLQIKAPFSGVITSLSVQEGQWLSVSEDILSLVDMSQRVVEIRVDVSNSARLNVGQEVVLSSEAFSGQSWSEKIVKIGEEAKTEDSVNVIKVQTSLGKKAPKLRIGQQVDAEIRVASRSDALLLPHNILFTHDGSPHAAVIENGKIVFIPVVTGIESVNQVEVVRGLRVDQEVIIPTGIPLESGMSAIATNTKINPG